MRSGGGVPTESPSSAPLRAVVLGGSLGGMDALREIVAQLPGEFALPCIVAVHLHKTDRGDFCSHLASVANVPVREVVDKLPLEPGALYTAPADYHLLVERDGALALSLDDRIRWARPSIDVVFESAARAFDGRLAAVILSGASDDGAEGMCCVRDAGGLCVAQDPSTAVCPLMPRAAIARAGIERVLAPAEIGLWLAEIGADGATRSTPSRRTER